MDLIDPIRTFLRVAEAGSFSAVAAERGTTQPTVSRQVAALEAHLGARLLARTTRALSLTDEGRSFAERARRVLEALEEAESAVGRRQARLGGTLRLSCPVVFGRRHVVPRLPGFMALHPELSIDLVMSDGFTDLVEEGIDLAIRVGEVTDPGLVARRIGATRRVTVAAPAYLAARGRPAVPQDLQGHDCIVYSRLATGNRWQFAGAAPEVRIEVEVRGRLQVNSSEGVREAVIAGLGIGVLPIWAIDADLAEGRLVPLLEAFEPRRLPMHAVYPSRRYVPARVRAMADHLAAAFRADPVIGG